MSSPKENILKNQNGQTFVEFIFLLVFLITISFTFMRGFNTYIGNRWGSMLKVVASPNQSSVNFP